MVYFKLGAFVFECRFPCSEVSSPLEAESRQPQADCMGAENQYSDSTGSVSAAPPTSDLEYSLGSTSHTQSPQPQCGQFLEDRALPGYHVIRHSLPESRQQRLK